MKKIIFTCVILCTLSLVSFGQKLSGGVGLNSQFENFLIGPQARIAYEISEKIKFSGAMTYYLKKTTNIAFDIDARYKLLRLGDVAFEPFIGFNIRRSGEFGDTSMNLGFYTFVDGEKANIYIEPKLILDTNSVFVLSVGYAFGN